MHWSMRRAGVVITLQLPQCKCIVTVTTQLWRMTHADTSLHVAADIVARAGRTRGAGVRHCRMGRGACVDVHGDGSRRARGNSPRPRGAQVVPTRASHALCRREII